MVIATKSAGTSLAQANLARFIRQHAIVRQPVTLSSGKVSDIYCDGKLVSFSGEGICLLVDALIDFLADVEFDAVGGMEMGAIPIVSALALKYYQGGREVPTFVVRKKAKEHGTKRRIEGPLPGGPKRVVIVDDVVTTGTSILDAIRASREAGYNVVLATSMLDREQGGRAALEAEGVRFEPLVKLSELEL